MVALEVSMVLPKRKGDKRVGIGWQYCGNIGKTANSQVAVFACLSNGDFASMN
jgi:SRSO17 transposase